MIEVIARIDETVEGNLKEPCRSNVFVSAVWPNLAMKGN